MIAGFGAKRSIINGEGLIRSDGSGTIPGEIIIDGDLCLCECVSLQLDKFKADWRFVMIGVRRNVEIYQAKEKAGNR